MKSNSTTIALSIALITLPFLSFSADHRTRKSCCKILRSAGKIAPGKEGIVLSGATFVTGTTILCGSIAGVAAFGGVAFGVVLLAAQDNANKETEIEIEIEPKKNQ